MKKGLALAVLMTAMISGSVFAYAGEYKTGKHHKGGYAIMKMVKKLDLSDDQKAQLKSIRKEMKQDRKADKESKKRHPIMSLDPMDPGYESKVAEIAREKAAKLEKKIIHKANMRKKVYNILTPSQREELKTLKKKKWEERRAYHERRAAEPFEG